MTILKIIIGLFILYIVCKIHEAWVIIKWDIDIDDAYDQTEALKDKTCKVFGSDNKNEENTRAKPAPFIYGPYTKQSAEIRAKNSQFIDGSIVIVQNGNIFTTYKCNNYTISKYIDADEATTKLAIAFVNKYIANLNTQSKARFGPKYSFMGIFTKSQFEEYKNTHEFRNNELFWVYTDQSNTQMEYLIYNNGKLDTPDTCDDHNRIVNEEESK